MQKSTLSALTSKTTRAECVSFALSEKSLQRSYIEKSLHAKYKHV